MDTQDFRSLQEAYMEVVMNELDEGYKELPVDKMVAKSKSLSRIPRKPGAPRWDRNAQRASDIRNTAGTHSRAKVKKVEKANRERGTQREEYDLYDIILSHLLDEGYAETIESAEAIMVNMSEEWREDIMEISDRKVNALKKARVKRTDRSLMRGDGEAPGTDFPSNVSKETRMNARIQARNQRTGSNVEPSFTRRHQ